MKKVIIAFDIDGTLRDNSTADGVVKANERIRTLLITLASFKNTKIVVWSGGGELYARQIVHELGLTSYVDAYYDKNQVIGGDTAERHHFKPEINPDIAIDDIQNCTLGLVNLIVREK